MSDQAKSSATNDRAREFVSNIEKRVEKSTKSGRVEMHLDIHAVRLLVMFAKLGVDERERRGVVLGRLGLAVPSAEPAESPAE